MIEILLGGLAGALASYCLTRLQRYVDGSTDRWRERQERTLRLAEELMQTAGELQVLSDDDLVLTAHRDRARFPVTESTESRLGRALDDLAVLGGSHWIGADSRYITVNLTEQWLKVFLAARAEWLTISGIRACPSVLFLRQVTPDEQVLLADEHTIQRLRSSLSHLVDRSEVVHRYVRELEPRSLGQAVGAALRQRLWWPLVGRYRLWRFARRHPSRLPPTRVQG